MKYRNCPFCGEQIALGNPHHLKNCQKYKEFLDTNLEELLKLYKDGYSVVELAEKYHILYHQIQKIIKDSGTPLRNIKDACTTKRRKERYKKTCLEHFGQPHNFCKESESRKAWEKRLLDEEGIVNVFQRKEVKEKIVDSLIKHYGLNYKQVCNSKEYYINKWIQDGATSEEAQARYERMCFLKGEANTKQHYINKYGEIDGLEKWKEHVKKLRPNFQISSQSTYISSLNINFYQLLVENNIDFEVEYCLTSSDGHARYFDFKVDNYLIELNGDFWHANPKIYAENDIINLPGSDGVLAKSLWEKDAQKLQLAQQNGFTVITLWECDLNDSKKLEKIKRIMKLYANNKN